MTEKVRREAQTRCYFVDEGGDSTLFNRRGRVVIATPGCSRFFMLGLLDIAEPAGLQAALEALRKRLLEDPYFKDVPSIQSEARKTARAFHAKDDIPEVRKEVFALLRSTAGLRYFAVVADKWGVLEYVRQQNERNPTYRYHPNELYDYLVRRLRRTARQIGDSYLQSVFLEMFGDPVRNPMGWKRTKIGDVVCFSQYGTSKKSSADKHGYPVIGMGNITYTGDIDLSILSYAELDDNEFLELQLERGDIIFNRTNSTELVGKTAHWDINLKAVIASYLVKLKLRDNVRPEYFTGLLNSQYYKSLFQLRCRKAVGQSNISPTYLKEFPILIPPLPLQNAYADIVSRHEKLQVQQREAERQAEYLFQSLLNRAFEVEVTPV